MAAQKPPQTLTILSLAAPFLDATPDGAMEMDKRTSNASSNEDRDNATPAILLANLEHYQELFSKLRFSYVEQVTKERFLRAITAEHPEFVDPNENVVLEEKLKLDKTVLKEKKEEVRELVRELEEQGRQLAARYDSIQLQNLQLAALPESIANLEITIAQLQQSQVEKSSNPELCMPLQPTLELLGDREEQLMDLDQQIEALRANLAQKQEEVGSLKDEVSILNTRKIKAVNEAKDARRRRENGGVGDELEEKGRWLRGVESSLRTMLQV